MKRIMLTNKDGNVLVAIGGIKYIIGYTVVGDSKVRSVISFDESYCVLVYETVKEINDKIAKSTNTYFLSLRSYEDKLVLVNVNDVSVIKDKSGTNSNHLTTIYSLHSLASWDVKESVKEIKAMLLSVDKKVEIDNGRMPRKMDTS